MCIACEELAQQGDDRGARASILDFTLNQLMQLNGFTIHTIRHSQFMQLAILTLNQMMQFTIHTTEHLQFKQLGQVTTKC